MLARIRNSLVAGLCGAAVHALLSLVHRRSGPLPGFQPGDDVRLFVSGLIGTEIHPALASLLLFVNAALIWGFLFGRLYRFLPGNGPWRKGAFFAVCAWGAMGLVFFPLVGRGPFAWRLGLGATPAALMLAMFLAYGLTMSFVYDLLERREERAAR